MNSSHFVPFDEQSAIDRGMPAQSYEGARYLYNRLQKGYHLTDAQMASISSLLHQKFGPSGSSFDSNGNRPVALDVNGAIHLKDPFAHNLDFDVEALWEKMYQHMRKVIVMCSYCGRPTVISEGNCPKCGAPLPVEFLGE